MQFSGVAETFKSFGTPISTITKFFTSYYGLFIYLAVFSLLFSSFWVVGIGVCFANSKLHSKSVPHDVLPVEPHEVKSRWECVEQNQ